MSAAKGSGIPALPAACRQPGAGPRWRSWRRSEVGERRWLPGDEWGSSLPPAAEAALCLRAKARSGAATPSRAPAAGWSDVDSPVPPFPTLGYSYRHPFFRQRLGEDQALKPRSATGSCTHHHHHPLRAPPSFGGCSPGAEEAGWGARRGGGGAARFPKQAPRRTRCWRCPLTGTPPTPFKSVLLLPVYGRGRKITSPHPKCTAARSAAPSAGGRQ